MQRKQPVERGPGVGENLLQVIHRDKLLKNLYFCKKPDLVKPILITAVVIVHLALFSYTVAIILQNRQKRLSKNVLTFLTLGVIFDIVSTICMVISSGNGLTLHGFIGYSSLLGMLTDTVLSFRLIKQRGIGCPVPPGFNRFSLTAYFYWVFAYISGALIVMLR